MTDTFGKRYLAELEQLLQAEAELRRQGTELLDDPEYRALRERFIEGEITLAQLSESVDNLAMTRGDEDVDMGEWRAGQGAAGGAEDIDDLEVLDDVIDEDDGTDVADGSDGAAGSGASADGSGTGAGDGAGGGGGDGD